MAIQRVEIHRSKLTSSINDFRTEIGFIDRDFIAKLNETRNSFERALTSLEGMHRDRMLKLNRRVNLFENKIEELPEIIEKAINAERKEGLRKIKELEAKIKELEKNGPTSSGTSTIDKPGVEKAKTLAIFDSILFAISNWSNDGQTAPDIELVCQSVLFPAVYERVMGGQSDYVIEKVPAAAEEVVKRGRELTQYLRSIEESSLVTPAIWSKHHNMIKEWIVGDALPLLYGARDPKWDEDDVLSLEEILEWRDQPASRALHFPLIFDGMELVERFRDEIRETTGLPDFTKATMSTRLEVL